MNALVVGASPVGVSTSRLAQEAAVADLVVAVDGGLTHVLSAGVTPSVLIGDLDSADPESVSALDDAVKLVSVPREKDVTDLELAVDWCVHRGATRLTAFGVTGGRLDHELAALGVLSRAPVPDVSIVDAAQTIRLVGPGSVEIGSGVGFSVVALSERATVSIAGAHWELHERVLDGLSGLGISNVAAPSGARVTVTEGRTAVIVPCSS